MTMRKTNLFLLVLLILAVLMGCGADFNAAPPPDDEYEPTDPFDLPPYNPSVPNPGVYQCPGLSGGEGYLVDDCDEDDGGIGPIDDKIE